MAIRLSKYMKIVKDPETGELKPFGRIGYQTMHQNTDKFTLLNMAAIERSLDAGNLTDINGEPATDGAYITIIARVNKVTPATDLEQLDTITGLNGKEVAVPAAPAAPVAVAGAVPAFAQPS